MCVLERVLFFHFRVLGDNLSTQTRSHPHAFNHIHQFFLPHALTHTHIAERERERERRFMWIKNVKNIGRGSRACVCVSLSVRAVSNGMCTFWLLLLSFQYILPGFHRTEDCVFYVCIHHMSPRVLIGMQVEVLFPLPRRHLNLSRTNHLSRNVYE